MALLGQDILKTLKWFSMQKSEKRRQTLTLLQIILMWNCDFVAYNFNPLRLKQNALYFTDDIFKWIFFSGNGWIVIKFHRYLFLGVQLARSHQLLRWWMGTETATSHYLNQWWLRKMTVIPVCVIRPQWVNVNRWDTRLIMYIKSTVWEDRHEVFGLKIQIKLIRP